MYLHTEYVEVWSFCHCEGKSAHPQNGARVASFGFNQMC